jgi:formylmethanofuran dehydrogenase subunit E
MVEHAKSLMPGEVLYDTLTEEQPSPDALSLEESVGRKALHDMTRIVPGESKQPKIVAGQTMGAGYLCRLQQMGRTRIFVEDERAVDADWLHENQAEAGSA